MFIVSNIIMLIGVSLNSIFIIFTLFFERKSPSRRLTWLLLLFFLPYVGMILYILFSGHFFTRTRSMTKITKELSQIYLPLLKEEKKILKESSSKLPNNQIKKYNKIITMNMKNANSFLSFTETVAIFTFGEHMYDALCNDIENATESIFMEFFIWRNDKTGKRILDLLCKKAQQGVKVKLIFDDLGSFFTPRNFFTPLKKAGGEVLPFFNLKRGVAFSVNFRNHRKISIIDGKIVYTGGMNIGDEYANCSSKRKWKNVTVRDTHIRITGSSVLALQTVFLIDWFSITERKNIKKDIKNISKYFPIDTFERYSKIISTDNEKKLIHELLTETQIPTQIVTSGPDNIQKAEIRDMLIRMILSAKKSVRIQTPYFTPDDTFLSVLKIAANSGINVEIIVPGKWDKWYVREAAFDFIRECLDSDIKFFAYDGFIHSKMCIVDGHVVTIGTTNIDTRSFDLHFEVNAVFYDQIIAKQCDDIFDEDKKNATALCSEDFNKHFILRRALWGFCRLFSPLM
ncbi:MAG: hypothetical protein GX220_00565 [Treponema sp.]|nr:hypothetical protein [Treponema sp.]